MNKIEQKLAPIRVSVCVVTYNQRGYIRECLESLVSQVTNFKFEILVGDDASTDGTSAIVAEYGSRYPDLVFPILHKQNIGPFKNYAYVHGMARGEYVCHVDGDDLALPGKLQKSNDVLDSDPAINIVFHRMKMRSDQKKKELDDLIDVNRIGRARFTRADMLAIGTIACHSSKMYRARDKVDLSGRKVFLDYYTDIIQVGDGVAFLINEFLGVYRVGVGISHSGKTKGIYLDLLKEFWKSFPEYRAELGANAFTVFLVDLKNLRGSALDAFLLFLRCLSLRTMTVFMRNLKFRFIFRVPRF